MYLLLKAVMRKNLNKLKPSAKGKLSLTLWKGGFFYCFFFFFFFCGGGGGVTALSRIFHIELIVHQRWAKTGEPGGKPLDHL